MMGLTMSQRKAVTKAVATRYRRASKAGKGLILDELCATTGWHRNHARKALSAALKPELVRPARRPCPPVYGPEVITALGFCWAVMGAPAGKRMAPFLGELVPRLRACGELDITDASAALLVAMSAATLDRRLAPDRAKLLPRGRSHTKPGSLLKSQIPIRTWADWDDAVPGFVEIDVVGHEGGNASGDFCSTLTVTDIATGWTENRTVKNKAQKWVFAALMEITEGVPISDHRHRFGQRRGVHQRAPAGVVHRAPHHVHPIASGEQERRRACGAEELGCGAPSRWLPPLRH